MKNNEGVPMPGAKRKNQNAPNGGKEENHLVLPNVVGRTKTYTCSMHPEVRSDKPGKCPKCGMELIEKK